MFSILVEKTKESLFNISPMTIKRDWMDNTSEKHAYRCFPVTQANVIGYSLSCIKEINFIWDGVNDESGDRVKIFSPPGAYSGRGQSSISIDTGLFFKTDESTSILLINPVNYFDTRFEVISSLISTSFYDNPLPLAIKAKTSNTVISIKAGTPIATIIPISLTGLNDTIIEIEDYNSSNVERELNASRYGVAAQKINSSGKWTDWYRNAVNEKNESVGSHEVKVLNLKVKDNTKGDII